MYKNILVTLNNSEQDKNLLAHVSELARLTRAHLLLAHVADGWAARNYDALKLAESEEMKADRAYLEGIAGQMKGEGLQVSTHLAMGDPPAEILKVAEREGCDLIAMTTHGHRLLGDIILGSTIENVRHKSRIPILVVRG